MSTFRFSDLPGEVKDHVFELLTQRTDWNNGMLVCQDWRDRLPRVAWRDLRFNINRMIPLPPQFGTQCPAATSLQHVRRFNCTPALLILNTIASSAGAFQLPNNVNAQIRTFIAPPLLQPNLLLQVFATFPNIRRLTLHAIMDDPYLATGTTIGAGRTQLAQNIKKLETLSITVCGQNYYQQTLTTAAILSQSAEKLARLQLIDTTAGPRHDVLSDIANVPWHNPPPAHPGKRLREIDLVWLDMHNWTFQLTPWLDLTQLETTRLVRCNRNINFLTSLTNFLRAGTVNRLDTFQMWQTDFNPTVHAAMESALNSFTGLKDVLMSTSLMALPRRQCTVQHSATLTNLTVYNCAYDVYDYADPDAILTACTSLTQLALELPKWS